MNINNLHCLTKNLTFREIKDSFVETLEADLVKLRENGVDTQIASCGSRMYVTLDRYENDWVL